MIKFTKMHGLGNDYVYIDCINQDTYNEQNLAKFISNRHFGVGSDGLILIKESKVADFRMQMFNSDGTEAEMCGNGIRCTGKFIYDKGLSKKEVLKIETLAGIKELKLNIKDGEIQTSKKYEMDEHGVGIKNIIEVITKYQGSYAIRNDNNEFYFSVILPN
jgi:diaminopimelate epimerase